MDSKAFSTIDSRLIPNIPEKRSNPNGNFDERKEDKDRHYIARRHLDGDADVVP